MTFDTSRQQIAEALSTIDGVQGFAKRPKVLNTGDAYPLLGSAERGPGLAFMATWRIIVILGKDEASAIDKTETLLPELGAALDPVAFVVTVTPFAVPTSGGDLFALEITARSD